jgi:hypothetical protein
MVIMKDRFCSRHEIAAGVGRWFGGFSMLARWVVRWRPLRKGAAAAAGDPAQRPKPRTEGEKALWEAMGWE